MSLNLNQVPFGEHHLYRGFGVPHKFRTPKLDFLAYHQVESLALFLAQLVKIGCLILSAVCLKSKSIGVGVWVC